VALRFAKLEGAGNSYLAIDGRDEDRSWSALARAMARTHFGVGSDGIAVVQRSRSAQVRMRIFNSDGSEAEMSGNGIRLFSKFVIDRGIAEPGAEGLLVETGGGLRRVHPTLESGRVVGARVAMGEPCFEPERIPVLLPERPDRVLDHPLALGSSGARGALALRITCLSIGNPHAVAFPEAPVAAFPLAEVGPEVQNHAAFPNRINFEIVNVIDPGNLRVRVFERGEGETPSSGTGSTAAAIAARLHQPMEDRIAVHLPGGTLYVEWPGSGEAFLEGPTVEVFTGVWPQ